LLLRILILVGADTNQPIINKAQEIRHNSYVHKCLPTSRFYVLYTIKMNVHFTNVFCWRLP